MSASGPDGRTAKVARRDGPPGPMADIPSPEYACAPGVRGRSAVSTSSSSNRGGIDRRPGEDNGADFAYGVGPTTDPDGCGKSAYVSPAQKITPPDAAARGARRCGRPLRRGHRARPVHRGARGLGRPPRGRDRGAALGYSNVKTNAFSARLSAARQFGLIALKDETYTPGALARSILHPVDPADLPRLYRQALLEPPLYAEAGRPHVRQEIARRPDPREHLLSSASEIIASAKDAAAASFPGIREVRLGGSLTTRGLPPPGRPARRNRPLRRAVTSPRIDPCSPTADRRPPRSAPLGGRPRQDHPPACPGVDHPGELRSVPPGDEAADPDRARSGRIGPGILRGEHFPHSLMKTSMSRMCSAWYAIYNTIPAWIIDQHRRRQRMHRSREGCRGCVAPRICSFCNTFSPPPRPPQRDRYRANRTLRRCSSPAYRATRSENSRIFTRWSGIQNEGKLAALTLIALIPRKSKVRALTTLSQGATT